MRGCVVCDFKTLRLIEQRDGRGPRDLLVSSWRYQPGRLSVHPERRYLQLFPSPPTSTCPILRVTLLPPNDQSHGRSVSRLGSKPASKSLKVCHLITLPAREMSHQRAIKDSFKGILNMSFVRSVGHKLETSL